MFFREIVLFDISVKNDLFKKFAKSMKLSQMTPEKQPNLFIR
jgi:hypothetical protein